MLNKILKMPEVSEITQFNLRTVGNEIDSILLLTIKRGFNREKIDSMNSFPLLVVTY